MNRNTESHFAELPSVELQRSIFDRSSTHKTSLNVSELVPIYCDEVLPGDSFKMTTSKVVRLQTLLTPVMDNLYLDTYWFFVPNRLVWNHWKEFCGENTSSAWVPQVEYQIPSISSPEGGFDTGTLADYFGLPVDVEWDNEAENRPSALPFRGYSLIAQEFFRDENLTDPLNIPVGDSNQTGTNGDNYINDVANGGKPFKVAKFHDYFTSCLPSPLKADQPVTFDFNKTFYPVEFPVLAPDAPEGHPLAGKKGIWVDTADRARAYLDEDKGINDIPTIYAWSTNPQGANQSYGTMCGSSSNIANTPSPAVINRTNTDYTAYGYGLQNLSPQNLYVDASNISGQELDISFGFSINELRLAFQLQKFYERNARGGTRYIEILKSHFGVTSPDSRLQRPEYLGGNRIPITIHEVTNNAQSQQDFLGDLGAKSITTDVHFDFEHSFTEHGYLFCLICMRYDHSYPQGLEKMWTRRKFTDFYLPVFANIGEQPVDTSEIYADATTMDVKDTFGYQEAWAEYRYKPDRVSGEMRPGISNTLASWHFADYYTEAPTLSDSWIREDKTNVDRTLAVTSATANQAFADFYFQCVCTRCMPMYSIPGLIDHH